MNDQSASQSSVDNLFSQLFQRHVDRRRHELDRQLYREAGIDITFESFLGRVYAVSWIVMLATVALGIVVIGSPNARETGFLVAIAVAVKYMVVRMSRRYLRWRRTARQIGIDRSLPGAVRYLWVISTGDRDLEAMIQAVAKNEQMYGQTAKTFQTVQNRAVLTGNLDQALRSVAHDTPSATMAPFLLKLKDHARQGDQELRSYLELEARMLGHRQAQGRKRRHDLLELLAELFVVLLVLPALLVIVVSVLSILSTGLDRSVTTPLGTISARGMLVYGCSVGVIMVGLITATTTETLVPAGHRPQYTLPTKINEAFRVIHLNPASTAVLLAPIFPIAGVLLWQMGIGLFDAVLLGYAAWGIPVGTVALRRQARDDHKDRELQDFIHAVAGHVSLGRTIAESTTRVAKETEFQALGTEITNLVKNTQLTDPGVDRRQQALERFGNEIGTPLAAQSVELLSSALAAGSNTEEVFDALETEVGRLYHEKRGLRESMRIYIAIGWTTALLIIAIVVAVNTYVVDGLTQLAAVTAADSTIAFEQGSLDTAAMEQRFYIMAQATMLACGWFAGITSRGRYVALLHSGLLVVIAYLVFTGVGMI